MKILNLGIVFEDLTSSQKVIEFATSINKSKIPSNVNITLFVKNNLPPCLSINAPILGMVDLHAFDGICVATSLQTLYSILQTDASKILHYIYYPEFIGDKAGFPHHKLHEFFTNPEIVRVARCVDYRDIIREEFVDCAIIDKVMPYFNIDILSAICKENFNG